jgi:hypothetical protein
MRTRTCEAESWTESREEDMAETEAETETVDMAKEMDADREMWMQEPGGWRETERERSWRDPQDTGPQALPLY